MGKTTYSVYAVAGNGYQAVKEGFCWPAFFFSGLWLLWRRLWWHAAGWLVGYLVFQFFDHGIATAIENTGQLPIAGILLLTGVNTALWLVPSFFGNRWLKSSIESSGAKWLGEFRACGPLDAVEVARNAA